MGQNPFCTNIVVLYIKSKVMKSRIRWCKTFALGACPGVSLFVLMFYGPVNPMGLCRARSVYLTTRLLGRLSPLSG